MKHECVSGNIFTLLRAFLRGSPCLIFMSHAITFNPGDPVEFASVELTTDFATVYEESGVGF